MVRPLQETRARVYERRQGAEERRGRQGEARRGRLRRRRQQGALLQVQRQRVPDDQRIRVERQGEPRFRRRARRRRHRRLRQNQARRQDIRERGQAVTQAHLPRRLHVPPRDRYQDPKSNLTHQWRRYAHGSSLLVDQRRRQVQVRTTQRRGVRVGAPRRRPGHRA